MFRKQLPDQNSAQKANFSFVTFTLSFTFMRKTFRISARVKLCSAGVFIELLLFPLTLLVVAAAGAKFVLINLILLKKFCFRKMVKVIEI